MGTPHSALLVNMVTLAQLRLFLKAGADVDKGRFGHGYTPLLLAIAHMQLAGNEAPCLVLKLLLEAGADANKESEMQWR